MLTRSVYCRRLVPSNVEEYEKDPAAYAGSWDSDPDGEIGEIVSETWIPHADPANPGGVVMKPIVGVCWENSKRPAISYEDLTFLENVDEEVESDEEEEEEEEITPEPEENFEESEEEEEQEE